jgi:hypothetical protein
VKQLEKLDPDEIVKTAARLRDRISERFPGAGLVDVAEQLVELASRAKRTSRSIRHPNWGLRAISYGIIAVIVIGAVAGAMAGLSAQSPDHPMSWADLVQALEAGINDIVLLGAAIYFVVHLETRTKRGRIVKALHELRTLAHLIDVHQLTKTPELTLDAAEALPTKSSPARKLTAFQLGRYLDYSSELLSLTGKIAAVYGDGFDDSESIEAVNEVEELTIGLSTKIWQKVILLQMGTPRSKLRGKPSVAPPALEPSDAPEGDHSLG